MHERKHGKIFNRAKIDANKFCTEGILKHRALRRYLSKFQRTLSNFEIVWQVYVAICLCSPGSSAPCDTPTQTFELLQTKSKVSSHVFQPMCSLGAVSTSASFETSKHYHTHGTTNCLSHPSSLCRTWLTHNAFETHYFLSLWLSALIRAWAGQMIRNCSTVMMMHWLRQNIMIIWMD